VKKKLERIVKHPNKTTETKNRQQNKISKQKQDQEKTTVPIPNGFNSRNPTSRKQKEQQRRNSRNNKSSSKQQKRDRINRAIKPKETSPARPDDAGGKRNKILDSQKRR